MAAAITFLIWLHTASKNLRALDTTYQQHSPCKAILWWFIPMAWIYIPYWVVREMWEASYPATSTPQLPGLLGPWWFTWLASGFANFIATVFLSPGTYTQNIVFITGEVLSLSPWSS